VRKERVHLRGDLDSLAFDPTSKVRHNVSSFKESTKDHLFSVSIIESFI
jgi:hypothetical protein